MSSNNNDDDNGESDNGMGKAYTTNEEYSNHLNNIRSSTNPVEYLEFVAAQEQYAPKNLSYKDSLPSSQLQQPTQEQFIHIRQAPSANVNYTMSPDDNLQQNLTHISNNNYYYNYNNYNPYFPPTEQQVQQFSYNKHLSNQLPLSPLDEVVHNNPYPDPYQIVNTNRQSYQPPSQYQRPQQLQYDNNHHYHNNNNNNNINNINNNINNNNDNNNNDNQHHQIKIDHSAVTPSPLSLPGLFLSRNRSRISTPKIENLPRIPNAYSAQVQKSDSPLRTEFPNDDTDDSDSDSSKNNVKNMLGEILNKDRLSNLKERSAITIKDSNESLVKFDFRNANGDPDDPLLNKNIQLQEEEKKLPAGLLNGGNIINNSNSNGSNSNAINTVPRQHSPIISPVSTITPISSTSQTTPIIRKDNEKKDDVINIDPDLEIKVYKPKQGTILMFLAIFILAAVIFVTWKLGDWGVGDAKDIYDLSTNNGILSVYPPGT